MKRLDLIGRPPIFKPENARDALQLLHQDMSKLETILQGAAVQLDFVNEDPGNDNRDWRHAAILLGLENSLEVCARFASTRINDTDSLLDKLPEKKGR